MISQGIFIRPPFFEVGPKTYLYGRKSLDLALAADKASEKYNIQIIYTPQYVDIPAIARETSRILVFAQHMDSLEPGRGIGAVLPEALREAGAVGVLLNHAEKRLTLSEISRTIRRADKVGLATMVCADTLEEAAAVAQLEPDIILAEPPDLIGTAAQDMGSRDYITKINAVIRKINPGIHVLHSAGISCGKDVYNLVRMGAEATGSTSGIIKAADPHAMLDEMVASMRKAWDETH